MAYKNYIKVYNIDGCSINEQYLLSFLINQPKDNRLFWKKNYIAHDVLKIKRNTLDAIIQHLTELGFLETKSYRNKGTQFNLLGDAKETRDMLLNNHTSAKKVIAKPKNQPQPKANNNDDEKKKPKYVEYSKKDLGEITEEFGITCLC